MPIPLSVSSQVLIANRHACCICQKPYVQLHHIDENPANNDSSNLAALCLDHHNLASMQIGLTKKLRADDIRQYKTEWETKCAVDIQALSRDRLRFYATVYKNPPRIRELFTTLSPEQRRYAAAQIQAQLDQDTERMKEDQGFKWQAVPTGDDHTRFCLMSLRAGELWPKWLPRVGGHPLDPDYPIDLAPPHGLTAFHIFDLYCQLLVRALAITYSSMGLEQLLELKDPEAVNSLSGTLVSFRERAIGKGLTTPQLWKDKPLGRVQFRIKKPKRLYRVYMNIKTMYVFSDTAALELQRSRVCGMGVLVDAAKKRGKTAEIHIALKPLIIGIGGLGQSTEDGLWLHNAPDHSQ